MSNVTSWQIANSCIIVNYQQIIDQKMGNTQFAIPHNLSHEWIEIVKSGQRLIHNTITQQNFILHKVAKNEALDTKSYIQRSIYPIPHSPKLIIIDDTASHFYFLVQAPSTNFKYLIRRKHLLIEVLTVLRDLTVIAHQLKQKYGSFQIREGMIGVLKSDEVMLWIHENNHSNERQFPASNQQGGEEPMIQRLIGLCQAHSKFDLSFLLKQFAGALNFKQFIKHLIIKIEVEKFRLSQKNIYLAQTHKDLDHIKKKEHAEPFHQKLTRTNTNLKNFDKATLPANHSTLRHRRNYTYTDFEMKNERSQSKSKTPERISPFKETFKHSWVKGNCMQSTTLKSIKSAEKPLSRHSPKSMEKSNPKFKYLRGTTGSVPVSEISFSCKLKPKNEAKIVLEKQWPVKKLENIATRSSEQPLEGEFEEREERRESTIRWAQEQIGWCQKSIEQDYQCLFTRPGRAYSKRLGLNRVQEQLNIHLDDD